MQPETRLPQDQEIGNLAEDFTLFAVNGGQCNLSALLKGKKGRLWFSGLACVRTACATTGTSTASANATRTWH